MLRLEARALVVFSFAILVLSPYLYAQTTNKEQIRQFEQQLQPPREAGLPMAPTPNIDFRIISPEKTAVPKAVDEVTFQIDQVEFEGLQFLTKEQAIKPFNDLLGKKINLSALRDAAQSLEDIYRSKGYFLVRVFIPPQKLTAGSFKVRVVEGFVDQVYVEGPNDSINELVKRYTSHLGNIQPLDLASLERALLLINDIPGIACVAVLRPGAALGASELLLTVQGQTNSDNINFNNTASRVLGPNALTYSGVFQQPFNSLGQIGLSVTAAGLFETGLAAVRSSTARYSQALGDRGLLGSLSLTLSKSLPSDYLSSLDLVSNAIVLSPKLRYPLQRGQTSSIFLESGLTLTKSETTIATIPLTLDQTAVHGESLSWVLNGWGSGTQILTAGVAQGIHGFGAMGRDDSRASVSGYDPYFLKYTWNFNRIQNLPSAMSLRINAMGQNTKDKLLSGEQIIFGASTIGRAFTPALIASDNGVGTLLELRRDLVSEPGSQFSNKQIYISTDWAQAKTLPISSSTSEIDSTLHSNAIGIRFAVDNKYQFDLRLTSTNQDIDTNDPHRTRRVFVEFNAPF